MLSTNARDAIVTLALGAAAVAYARFLKRHPDFYDPLSAKQTDFTPAGRERANRGLEALGWVFVIISLLLLAVPRLGFM